MKGILRKIPLDLGVMSLVSALSVGLMVAGGGANLHLTISGGLYQADDNGRIHVFNKGKMESVAGKISRILDVSQNGDVLAGVEERRVLPNTEEIGGVNLFVTDLEGSYAKQITSDLKVFQARWSPRGNQFVYVTRDMKLYLATPDGGVNQRISDGAVEPHWSADGNSLVYSHFDEPFTGASGYTVGIATYDLTTGKEVVYTSGYDDCNPIFSVDKKRVLFYSSLRTGVASEYILNLADGKFEQITNVGLTNAIEKGFIPVHLSALWSKDGRTVVIQTRYSEKEIWMLRLDGNRVVKSQKLGSGESPRWIVDGRSLAFMDTGDGAPKLKKVEWD